MALKNMRGLWIDSSYRKVDVGDENVGGGPQDKSSFVKDKGKRLERVALGNNMFGHKEEVFLPEVQGRNSYEGPGQKNNREIHGSVIPWYTPQQVEDLFGIGLSDEAYIGKGDNIWIIPLLATDVRSIFCQYGEVVVRSELLNRKCARRWNISPWWVALSVLPSFIGGQLKNFLVALATGLPAKEGVKIMFKGSKANSRGGLWINYYKEYLKRMKKKAVVDLFDLGEVECVEVDGDVTLNHRSSYYYGDGEEYDVVVDDSYDQTEIKLVLTKWKSERWSVKNHSGSDKFFHPTEGRDFSHPIDMSSECKTCSLVRAITSDIQVQEYLLRCIHVLRQSKCLCADSPVSSELSNVGKVMVNVLRDGFMTMNGPMDVRSVLALSEEMPLAAVDTNRVVRSQLEAPLVHVHGEGFVPQSIIELSVVEEKVYEVGLSVSESALVKGERQARRMEEVPLVTNTLRTAREHWGSERVYCLEEGNLLGYSRGKRVGRYSVYDRDPQGEDEEERVGVVSMVRGVPWFNGCEKFPGVWKTDDPSKVTEGPLLDGTLLEKNAVGALELDTRVWKDRKCGGTLLKPESGVFVDEMEVEEWNEGIPRIYQVLERGGVISFARCTTCKVGNVKKNNRVTLKSVFIKQQEHEHVVKVGGKYFSHSRFLQWNET